MASRSYSWIFSSRDLSIPHIFWRAGGKGRYSHCLA